MVDQNVENKIKEYLDSPEKFKKVIKFLEKEANADYNIILVASISVDQTFQDLVNKLVKEIDNPSSKAKAPTTGVRKHSSPFPDGKLGAVSDCTIQTHNNTSSSWIEMETVIRVTGKFAGAVVGTAVSPGIGTVIGGLVGGQLSTSLAGMMQS
ncbi:uncharacterized protein LOC116923159 [Daphnia magna]|uniref:Uncharacterized protein n=1 Tax=Daphnia magna TaxID=35525 RepID=A0A164LDF1_9CRUS|nr:uncharacterized protein LOC116923159 [Daphnia magna]KZS04008.1 Uncharacterized protein APZ42_033109 [Daphnia magna]